MKNVKRIMSVILCVLMTLSMLSLTGFAEAEKLYYGDVNRDGKVTSTDSRLILRVAALLDVLPDELFVFADVNEDGKISSTDARKALRVSAMLDPLVEMETMDIPVEDDVLKKLSTFVVFEEYEEIATEESEKAYKNLANNIIIADARENKTPLTTSAIKIVEGELAGMYSILITDENIPKTYELVSDNNLVIVLAITDFGGIALRHLSCTNADEMLSLSEDEQENTEIVGIWLEIGDNIEIPERESISITEENIELVETFKEYEGIDEAKIDYPNAKFYANEAQNVVIIDQRTNKTPLNISCTIGLDTWEEETVFITLIKTETDGHEKEYDFEVGEKTFSVVNLTDTGFSAFSSGFGLIEDYVKL